MAVNPKHAGPESVVKGRLKHPSVGGKQVDHVGSGFLGGADGG